MQRTSLSRRQAGISPGRIGRTLLFLGGLVVGSVLANADAPAETGSPAPPKPREPASNSSAACLECHSDPHLTMKRAGRVIPLTVDGAALTKSAHSSLECIDCHEGLDGGNLPHKKPLMPVACASCHDDTSRKHVFHPRLAQSPVPAGDDTGCTGCHGAHAVARVKSAGFPFARGQQEDACGRCHQPARSQFLASAHGRALASRLPDAPTCLHCHSRPVAGPPAEKPRIELKLAQTALCESCHLKKPDVGDRTLLGSKFVASFEQSVHGAALQRGLVEAANCVDCHGSHEMNHARQDIERVAQRIPLGITARRNRKQRRHGHCALCN